MMPRPKFSNAVMFVKEYVLQPRSMSEFAATQSVLLEKATNSGTSGVLQDFAQPAANDQIFAGLQHPDPYDDGVFSSGQSGAGRTASGAWVEFDSRFALAHLLHDFQPGGTDASGIVGNQQMRDVVGDGRDENCGFDGRYFFYLLGNAIGAFAKLRLHCGVVLAQKPIHSGDHADDVFLGDFQAATDSVGIGRIIEARSIDEIFSSEKQAVHCGPRMPLPPENATRSKPICV